MINKLLSHLDFKSLFNLLGEAVVYIDVSGTIAYMNKTAVDLLTRLITFPSVNLFTIKPGVYLIKSIYPYQVKISRLFVC